MKINITENGQKIIENRIAELEKIENEARLLSKELDSKIRFSPEWMEVMNRVIIWTKENNRPLYYTYNE